MCAGQRCNAEVRRCGSQVGQKRKQDAAFVGASQAPAPAPAAGPAALGQPAPVQSVSAGGYYGMPGPMAPVGDASAYISLRPGMINGDGLAHGVAVGDRFLGQPLGLGGPAGGAAVLGQGL